MDIITSSVVVVVSSILFGITMKVADLLNEHGLKWFKHSDILFGILWGIFGSLLILIGGKVIGSAMLAMNVAFIIRNRLDYINHQIAASLIIITGMMSNLFEPKAFLIFFLIFLVFGSLKDYVDDRLHSKTFLAKLNESMLYYPIPTLIYGILFDDWMLFIAFTLYTISYDLTKLIAKKYGYK